MHAFPKRFVPAPYLRGELHYVIASPSTRTRLQNRRRLITDLPKSHLKSRDIYILRNAIHESLQSLFTSVFRSSESHKACGSSFVLPAHTGCDSDMHCGRLLPGIPPVAGDPHPTFSDPCPHSLSCWTPTTLSKPFLLLLSWALAGSMLQILAILFASSLPRSGFGPSFTMQGEGYNPASKLRRGFVFVFAVSLYTN